MNIDIKYIVIGAGVAITLLGSAFLYTFYEGRQFERNIWASEQLRLKADLEMKKAKQEISTSIIVEDYKKEDSKIENTKVEPNVEKFINSNNDNCVPTYNIIKLHNSLIIK